MRVFCFDTTGYFRSLRDHFMVDPLISIPDFADLVTLVSNTRLRYLMRSNSLFPLSLMHHLPYRSPLSNILCLKMNRRNCTFSFCSAYNLSCVLCNKVLSLYLDAYRLHSMMGLLQTNAPTTRQTSPPLLLCPNQLLFY